MRSAFLISKLGIILELVLAGKDLDLPTICPNIITRVQWNARRPHAFDYLIIPVINVIIHHTVTPKCNTQEKCTAILREIQNFHMDTLEFHDIGYNFMIGDDGRVYEGVGWHRIGAHTRGYNSRSIGIALIGNYTDILPNSNMFLALKKLLACGVELGELDKNYKLFGARQVSGTASPGHRLFAEIKKWPHFTRNP
ncbi:unnamed protein product [Ceutorhynchus assimilis]|uniref:Peptidoglycan-recognition protein n=1 Tax=Ceutorhynchus assimilis TaxID=467358 RepID=A0A9N9QI53_9CUCU|nr:unnamed protein product [Ceutorhynchus assimilis]